MANKILKYLTIVNNLQHKQASDDEDNEIEIVEPKTDLITLDSDDDEPPNYSTPVKKQTTPVRIQKVYTNSNMADVKVRPFAGHPSIAPGTAPATEQRPPQPPQPQRSITPPEDNMDLMSMAQTFLASMLEVDIHEGSFNSPALDAVGHKKQPRKKLTNKPNPTLLKQKAIMERERLEEMKRNDQKLKMKCAVALKKAEDEFPYAKEMLEAKAKEIEIKEKATKENEAENILVIDDGKKLFEVEVILEDDVLNSSTEEQNAKANDDTAIELSTESIVEEETKKLKDDTNDETANEFSKEKEAMIVTKISEEPIKEVDTIISSTDKINGKNNDKTTNELSKDKDADMETEEISDEAKKKSVESADNHSSDITIDIAQNPKDDSNINNEKAAADDISEEVAVAIAEKLVDKINENSLVEEKDKSIEVQDKEPEQSKECLQNENEISKEILENEKMKTNEDKEMEKDTTITTKASSDDENEKVSREFEKPDEIKDNQFNGSDGTDDKHKYMETDVEEVMNMDNEMTSPQKSNISRVKSLEDEAELDVHKEIEQVLKKGHDDVEELNDETKTDEVKEIFSSNKVTSAVRTSPQKDFEGTDHLASQEQTLETSQSDDDKGDITNTSSNGGEVII